MKMNKLPDEKVLAAALEKAKEAASHAYAPYSQFPVGACIITKEGDLIPGCNVENASYPLGNCAERTALHTAIAYGCQPEQLEGIVIYTPTKTTTSPCGACRQVMAELLGLDGYVICASDAGMETYSVKELLPRAFTL